MLKESPEVSLENTPNIVEKLFKEEKKNLVLEKEQKIWNMNQIEEIEKILIKDQINAELLFFFFVSGFVLRFRATLIP